MDDDIVTEEVNNPEYTLYLSPEDEEAGKKEYEEAKKKASQSGNTTSEETPETSEPTTGTDTVFDGATINETVVLKETFSATNSTIAVKTGDTFSAENVTTDVRLSGNQISNEDSTSAFLRAKNSNVNIAFSSQIAEGDFVLDNLSTMTLVLSNSSYYMGVVNGTNSAKTVSVSIDGTSQLILAGDSYVDILTNADSTNMNIYSNGYKLYVAGQEVEVNGSAAPEVPEPAKEEPEPATPSIPSTPDTPQIEQPQEANNTAIIVAIIAVVVIIAGIIAVLIHNKKKNGPVPPSDQMTPPPAPNGGRPDFSAFDDGPVSQPASPSAPNPTTTPPSNGTNQVPPFNNPFR